MAFTAFTVLPLVVFPDIFLFLFLSSCSGVSGRLGCRLCAGGILLSEFHLQPRLHRLSVQPEHQTSQSTGKNYDTLKPRVPSLTLYISVHMNEHSAIRESPVYNLIYSLINVFFISANRLQTRTNLTKTESLKTFDLPMEQLVKTPPHSLFQITHFPLYTL